MGAFSIKPIVQIAAWIVNCTLVYLNIRMVLEQAGDFFMHSNHLFWKIIILLGGFLFVVLLLVTIIHPLINKKLRDVQLQLHKTEAIEELQIPAYSRIAVALDFSVRDRQLIAHAIKQSTELTKIILIHIVESASAKILGTEADDLETRKDQEKLDEYVSFFAE